MVSSLEGTLDSKIEAKHIRQQDCWHTVWMVERDKGICVSYQSSSEMTSAEDFTSKVLSTRSFKDRVPLCDIGWPGTCSENQAGLERTYHLTLLSKCWPQRYAPYPASRTFFCFCSHSHMPYWPACLLLIRSNASTKGHHYDSIRLEGLILSKALCFLCLQDNRW